MCKDISGARWLISLLRHGQTEKHFHLLGHCGGFTLPSALDTSPEAWWGQGSPYCWAGFFPPCGRWLLTVLSWCDTGRRNLRRNLHHRLYQQWKNRAVTDDCSHSSQSISLFFFSSNRLIIYSANPLQCFQSPKEFLVLATKSQNLKYI